MTCDYTQLANNGVQQLRPYQPGKPVEELQRELGLRDVVKLASNENPLGPSHRALEAARRSLDQIHLYPDGAGFELKHALADNLGVSSDRITLGNGSNDVLELVARVYLQPGDEAVFSEYAFAIYPLVTLGCSAKPVSVDSHLYGHDLAAMADAITERTRVVFLANPNNPTGTWFNDQALDNFLARVPERVIVVLDEAYFEYVEESHYPDGLKRLDRYPNLVVTRTFSKIHGLAGLRVGYGLSHPDVADLLNRVRQPFNNNSMALLAAEAALEDPAFVADTVTLCKDEIARLTPALEGRGLTVLPSQANFITVDFGRDAAPIHQGLLERGVIVRPTASYQMPNCLRVSLGTVAEDDRFLAALDEVLAAS